MPGSKTAGIFGSFLKYVYFENVNMYRVFHKCGWETHMVELKNKYFKA